MIRSVLRSAMDQLRPRRGMEFVRAVGRFAVAGLAFAATASETAVAAPGYAMTPERLAASTASLAALTGVLFAALALTRSAGRNETVRRWGTPALVLGSIGLVVGGLVVATADGGLGSGQGLAGGVVAMGLGLVAIVLGGLARIRSRRVS